MGFNLTTAEILAYFSWALAVAWLWKGTTALFGMRSLPDLSRTDPGTLPPVPDNNGPNVTVVVPARDEEAAIDRCLRSLLSSTGLRLQIIAVDDRSTDSTGQMMDTIAVEAINNGSPHHLEVIHIRGLPAGWLGKPHALAAGADRATAPWILFTDGDVIFAPRALELAIREVQSLSADHLVLVPTLILKGMGERAVLAAMQALALWAVRLWKVADPQAHDFIGAGGFNMIRRNVYQQIGGFEALRMEILEDLYLGKRVKQGGFAQRVALGPGLVRVRWIDGPFAVLRLVEKNGFAITRFRTAVHMLACASFLVHGLWPLFAIARGGWTTVAGLLTFIGIILVNHANCRASRVSARYALLFTPAALVITWGFLRSMLLALVRRGVIWRGTLYSLSELRHFARNV